MLCHYNCAVIHEIVLYMCGPFYLAWDKYLEYSDYENFQAADICQRKQYGRE